jgi:hypothetical protein
MNTLLNYPIPINSTKRPHEVVFLVALMLIMVVMGVAYQLLYFGLSKIDINSRVEDENTRTINIYV